MRSKFPTLLHSLVERGKSGRLMPLNPGGAAVGIPEIHPTSGRTKCNKQQKMKNNMIEYTNASARIKFLFSLASSLFVPLTCYLIPQIPPFFFRCLPLLLRCYEMYVGGGGFHLLLRLLLHLGLQLKETRVKSYIGRGSSDDFISLSKKSERTRLQSKRGQIDFKGRRRTIPMTLQVS